MDSLKAIGTVKYSPDMAGNALSNALVDHSGSIMMGGLALSGVLLVDDVTVVGVADDLAIPVVIGGAALAGVAAKATYEIQRIQERRKHGPDGVQYSLRATTSGVYPCFTCPLGTTLLGAGDVWKYGETTNPSGRYPVSYLKSNNLWQNNEFHGNQMQIKIAEKSKIYGYFLQGSRQHFRQIIL